MKFHLATSVFLGVALLSSAGCGADPAPKGQDTDTTTTPTPTPTDTDTVSDTAEPTTPTTEPTTTPFVFDCKSIPAVPGVMTEVPGAGGSYDLIFDDLGYIIGWDNGLMKADAYGNAQLINPTIGISQGMAWLPDGDLVVSENTTGALLRVDMTTGGSSLLSTDVYAYGVKVGPDGLIYAGTDYIGGNLVRIDPVTGVREMLIDDARFNVRSIDFSPDYTKLYMGTYLGDGRLWVVDLDATYTPIGDAYVFHPEVGNGTEHDALGVDFCGNIYVIDYGTNTMYRLTPAGQKTTLFEFSSGQHYGHGITWGSGINGWNPYAIYMPEPWYGNTVISVDVGVPSRSYVP